MGKLYMDQNPSSPTLLVNTQMVPGVQPVQSIVNSNYSGVIQNSEKIVFQDREVTVEIEKIVYVDKPITIYETKEVEVIKEVPVYQDRIVYKDVIREVEVPTIQIRDVFHDRIVEIPRITVRYKIPDWGYFVFGIQSLMLVLSILIKK